MKLGIRSKLVITLLCANGLLAGLMLWLSTESFNRGFIDYVNQVEVQKLDPLVSDLITYHQRFGGWSWVNRDQRRLWRLLIRQHLLGRQLADRRENLRRQTPGNASNEALLFDPRLLLRDAHGQLVIGARRPPPEVIWIPIETNGTLLGELGLVPRSNLTNRLEQLFAFQQKRNLTFIIIAAVVIALSLALVLALFFLKPIRELTRGVHLLADGKLDTVVPITSRDELGQLAEDVNQLARTLRENRDARQQWMADISHELRTPVTILQGELEALIDGVRTVDQNSLISLQQETRRLGRLIDDLNELAMSDLGAINYQFETVDLQVLITDFLESNRATLQTNRFTLDFVTTDQATTVSADEQRINQLLANLFQNTLRYTDEPGTLSVSLSVQSNYLIVRWEDSAPGVENNELALLFDRLYRVEKSRNRAKGGSGLGLSICENIAAAHNASIEAYQSSLGGLGIRMAFPLDSRRQPT